MLVLTNLLPRSNVDAEVKWYNEMGDSIDRPREGCPHSVCLPNVIHAFCEHVRWNRLHIQKRMAEEMSASTWSVSHISQDDLKHGAYGSCIGHTMSPRLRDLSDSLCHSFTMIQGKEILQHPFHCWNFSIQQTLNHQNDRVYVQSCHKFREKMPQVTRVHHPPSVMVWWGMSYSMFGGAYDDARVPNWLLQRYLNSLLWRGRGVKTDKKVYRRILGEIVEPLQNTLFEWSNYWFARDSGHAHEAKVAQLWLMVKVPNFIMTSERQSGTPDLNPMDYSLCCRPASWHTHLAASKASIIKAMQQIPLKTICESSDGKPRRLHENVGARGGDHFEFFF